MSSVMHEVGELSRSECDVRLRAGNAGRLAVATPAGPHIAALAYAVVGDDLVLRTTPYSVVGSHGRGALVAFEVDDLDTGDETGWSVVVRGRTEAVTDESELRALEALESWPTQQGSRRTHLRIRLAGAEITGRLVGAARACQRVVAPLAHGA